MFSGLRACPHPLVVVPISDTRCRSLYAGCFNIRSNISVTAVCSLLFVPLFARQCYRGVCLRTCCSRYFLSLYAITLTPATALVTSKQQVRLLSIGTLVFGGFVPCVPVPAIASMLATSAICEFRALHGHVDPSHIMSPHLLVAFQLTWCM